MTTCPTCSAALVTTDWGALCAACALLGGMTGGRELVGGYERFQLLGEGSMGAVYLAKHVGSDEVVALKLAKAELLDHPGGVALFRQQAKIQSALKADRNIVGVQDVGSHEGRPFMVMEFMEGGTLSEADNMARYAEPLKRLKLMLAISRAVQFAHERGVLHCDLKPDNILFDAEENAKVSDFGMARQLVADVSTPDGVQGGTPGWMSPEQVRGEALTTASDVFALGMLLHWLGTGEHPFGDGEDFEARVLTQPNPRLRSWTPELSWGLSAIAHRAMQKEPGQRYGSAAALVDDLERLKTERPLRGQAIPPYARAWHWSQRYRDARYALFLLLPAFAALTMLTAETQRAELRQAVLDMNAYAASGQAAAVLYQLKEYAEVVERAAADPAVKMLTGGARRLPRLSSEPQGPCRAQTSLEDPAALSSYALKFATFFVLDTDGCPRARISEESTFPDYVRTSYDWRDYLSFAVADAPRPGRPPHVRAAYRSSISKLLKFAVSTPLFEGANWLGTVSGSIIAASTLELPRMKRNETNDQMTVLLGPFDGGREGTRKLCALPEFTLLVHPRLPRGDLVTIEPALSAELARAFRPAAGAPQFELAAALPLQRADYQDPLLRQRWLAAFAPVGGTGYVVLVQTLEAVAIRPASGLYRIAITLVCGSAALLLTYGFFLLWRRSRSRAIVRKPA